MFGIGTGVGSTFVGIVIGFFTGNPLYGLVIGVVVGMLLLAGFATRAVLLASAGAPAEAGRTARQIQPDTANERLEEENRRLESENERLRAENEQYASQPDADQLKQRCLQLSEELFQFVDERDELNPQKNPEQNPGLWNRSKKETAHDEATMAVYARQFAGRVRAALDAADRRGWITSVERKALEDKLTGSGTYRSPEPRIREVAQRLEAFGHRL